MNEQNTAQTGKNRTVLIVIGALVLAAAAVFVTFQLLSTAAGDNGTNGQNDAGDQTTLTPTPGGDESEEDDVTNTPTPTPPNAGGGYLPEKMNGQEAIDALGDNIDAVAKKNGKTTEELKDLLLRNKTAFVTPGGHLVYLDNAKP